MFPLSTAADQEHSVLAPIWVQLSSDLQHRIIALVAELALSVMVARSQNKANGEEVRYANAATDAQNPS